MLSSADPIVKCYTERGVQTAFTAGGSTQLWLTRSVSNGSSTLANHGSVSQVSSRALTPVNLYPPTILQSPCSLPVPDTPSPIHDANYTHDSRPKRQKTPYARPPGTMKSKIRVVSLPEAPGPQKLADIFRDHQESRVVSLPARITASLSAENSINTSQSQEKSFQEDLSFFPSKPRYSGIRVRPSEPHTPSNSPPSSPDSILFTNDRQQLPDLFLRDNGSHYGQKDIADDEGWITWAHSPPRPIPALHGPLSLPYARCPSGAEGTIIEGQDDLPRMIWGMDINDAPPKITHDLRSLSKVREHSPHHKSVKAPVQTAEKKPMYLATPRPTPTLPATHGEKFQTTPRGNDRPHPVTVYPKSARNLEQRDPDTAHTNVTTLNDMLRHGTAKVSGTWDSLYGNTRTRRPEHALDIFNMTPLDWQVLRTQGLREPLLSSNYHRTEPDHLLKPSAPVFVPGVGQFPMIAYPRIFVESRSPQRSRDASLSSRISSAHLSPIPCSKTIPLIGLPTPPSSASPQWSSTFSPYQISSQSPELPLSQPIQYTKHVNQKKPRPPVDSSHELRKFVHERISSRATENLQSSSAAAFSRHLQDHQPATSKAPQKPKYMQHLRAPSSFSVDSSRHPGPPPNLPLPPLPSPTPQSVFSGPRLTSTPPPDLRIRTRSISYQHPRSVPLARLLQRRLASVPEEELSYRTRSPSPQSSLWQSNASSDQSRARNSANQHYKKSTAPTLNRNPSPSPSPIPTSFDLHGARGKMGGDAIKSVPNKRTPPLHAVPAKVNLPSSSKDHPSKRSTETKANFRGSSSKRRGRARKDKSAVAKHSLDEDAR